MKNGLFLNLINLIIIFCYNKIEKGNSFEDFKNIRHLQEVITEEPNDDPTPIFVNNTDSENSTDSDFDDEEYNEDLLFLGVDNYYNDDTTINFHAYFYLDDSTNSDSDSDSDSDYQEYVFFTISIQERILRMLPEVYNDEIICNKIDDSGKVCIYNCTYEYYGNIDSIIISYPGNKTEYAEYALRNIKNQTGQIISSGDFFFITDCTIPDTSKNVIKGKTDYKIDNNAQGVVYMTNDTTKEEIPVTFIKEDENGNYNIILNLKKGLTKNLNNTVGTLNNKNTTFVFLFKQDGNSTMNFENKTTLNKAYIPKKSSGGLSTGGILAIIIPCIIVLLAAAGLAAFLSKSSSGAAASTISMENMNIGSNTIGISNSSNVIVKNSKII